MRGGTEADAPSHFLLFSPFPVAQNLMGVGGVVPSQQSPFGPSFLLPDHITEIGGLPQVTSPFSGVFNP